MARKLALSNDVLDFEGYPTVARPLGVPEACAPPWQVPEWATARRRILAFTTLPLQSRCR